MLFRRPRARTLRTVRSLAVAAVLAALGAACAPGIGAPGSAQAGPMSCVATVGSATVGSATVGSATVGSATVGSGTSTTATPLAPPVAAARADATYREEAETPAATVPIVTVETTPAGPRVETHTVDSAAEAAAVATHAARGADLVRVEPEAVVSASASPNDARRNEQWAFDRTSFGAMWPYGVAAGVTIAVIDTGVDATHPDLAGQVLAGCTFVTGSSAGTLGANDDHGHGTHVAGIAGASTNNRRGIRSGAPGAKILPVKVLDQNGSGYTSSIANGLVWAANNGADVVNMSLGGPSNSGAIADAVSYARGKGVTVVAAAGNDAQTGNRPMYPGATPGVIAVGAVDSSIRRAAFSNVGSYVDVAAPGVGILSTVPRRAYSFSSGTSMATPYVAAAAAIVQAARTACTPSGIEARLTSGVSPAGPAGRDPFFGSGLVNPLRALSVGGC